jgi:predicted phosphodiesterase
VESSSKDPVTVVYGANTRYGSSAKSETIEPTTASTFVHNVRITGLRSNTVYHYRAIQDSDTSSDAAFRTAVDPGTNFRFAWFADNRTGTAVHDTIAKRIAEANPVVALYGGDLAATSAYAKWKDDFFRPNQLALISRIPFFNATGNHEGWKTNTIAFTQTIDSASSTVGYFSTDYGDMHVLVLNTEIPYSQGTPQYLFAEHDLAGTTKKWKIVIAHKHPYCAGGHGEDDDLKVMVKNIFEPRKIDLMISGHSHFYQHNVVNGIPYLILGSAGAPLYTPETASYTVKTAKEYNYGIADVSPRTFRLLVYNHQGAVLDSVILSK